MSVSILVVPQNWDGEESVSVPDQVLLDIAAADSRFNDDIVFFALNFNMSNSNFSAMMGMTSYSCAPWGGLWTELEDAELGIELALRGPLDDDGQPERSVAIRTKEDLELLDPHIRKSLEPIMAVGAPIDSLIISGREPGYFRERLLQILYLLKVARALGWTLYSC